MFLVNFWFSFVDCMLVYRYAYMFVQLCIDVHVMHVVLLCIGHDSCYAVSNTHWVGPQYTLVLLVLLLMWLQYIRHFYHTHKARESLWSLVE